MSKVRAHFVDGPVDGRVETIEDVPEWRVAVLPELEINRMASAPYRLVEFTEARYVRAPYSRTPHGTVIYVYQP